MKKGMNGNISRGIDRKDRSIDRRELLAVTGSTVVATISGCQERIMGEDTPPIEDVDVSLIGIRPPNLGLTNATITLVLQFINRANERIPNPEVDYQLFLNDVEVGTSRLATASIPARDEVNETIEAVVEYTDIGGGVKEAIEDGSFEMRVEGTLESNGATKNITLLATYS